MNQPAQTSRWIVICFKGRRPVDAQRIENEMKDVASKKGMRFGDLELFEDNDTSHVRTSEFTQPTTPAEVRNGLFLRSR